MRVLITGNKGFIGQHICSRLAEAGFQTQGFDIVDGDDILNAQSLARKADGYEVIIHLAAIEEPSPTRTMETNLQGTWNVLCAAKENNVKKIIFMSSVDALGVFQGEGTPVYLPLDDDYPCHPRTPYALSKKLAEEMCHFFSDSTGISIICLRPPGVWNEATYYQILAARKKRQAYEWDPYWEYGAFIDVRDLAEAVLAAVQKRINGFHCLLLASDDITTSSQSSLDLVNKIHPGVKWNGGKEYDLDPFKSLVNTNQAKNLLHWSPKFTWRKFQEELNATKNKY
jgi:UDP-glucose 4-epimerase